MFLNSAKEGSFVTIKKIFLEKSLISKLFSLGIFPGIQVQILKNDQLHALILIVWKLWTKDRIERDVWWMVVIGFIGILTILKPKNLFQLSSLIGILSAIFSAFAVVALKNLNRKGESLSRTLLYFFIVGSLFSFLLALHSWKSPTFHELFLLISLGLLSIFAQIFLTTAYRYGTASFLSPLSYSIIIFTALFSWFFFHQIPSWNMLIGTILIIGGGTLSYILRIHPTQAIEVFERQNNSKKWWQFWKRTPKI